MIPKHRKDVSHSSSSSFSPSPEDSSCSGRSPSFEALVSAIDPCLDLKSYSTPPSDHIGLSDTDLYNHYLQHTSRTLIVGEDSQRALKINIPELASRSEIVLHSLFAVSAACICHDMISENHIPDTREVNKVLMAGYEHFNVASQLIRETISSPGTVNPEELLASAVLLVPFATSSQQVNHWVSSRDTSRALSRKRLSTTPRDAIIIMRAVRATLQTLHHHTSSTTLENSPGMEVAFDSPGDGKISFPAALAPSRTHIMLPILANTIHCAFTKLQQRLESTFPNHGDDVGALASACGTAFQILKYISNKTFSTSDTNLTSSANVLMETSFDPTSVPLPQVAPWLRSFSRKARDPLPTEPLTSLLLSFLVQVPQAYLDFVLPLLDQRLENPISAKIDNITTELTREQALALDIYAHWSVLMFLVGEDSWWIGDLPVVTLLGMLNRYGGDFVAVAWPEEASGPEEWWPGSMLGILQTIRRYR